MDTVSLNEWAYLSLIVPNGTSSIFYKLCIMTFLPFTWTRMIPNLNNIQTINPDRQTSVDNIQLEIFTRLFTDQLLLLL